MSTEAETPPRPAIPGVEKFQGYLTAQGLSVQGFCEMHRHPAIERTKVVRILNGERTRIGVDFARAVHEATKGEVPWWSWTVGGEAPSSDAVDELTVDRGADFNQAGG